MVIATALSWGEHRVSRDLGRARILVRVLLTVGPLLRAGVPFSRARRLAFASDTLSIATMEIVDNAFILLVPGAIAAGLSDSLFWWSLALSLVIAFVVAVPVNRWLIARGRGHAVLHGLH